MRELIPVVEDNDTLLWLLETSYLQKNRKDLAAQLNKHYASIAGQEADPPKDIYSDFINLLGYVHKFSPICACLISLTTGERMTSQLISLLLSGPCDGRRYINDESTGT